MWGRRGWRIVVGFDTGVVAVNARRKVGKGFGLRRGLLGWLRMESEFEVGIGRVMVFVVELRSMSSAAGGSWSLGSGMHSFEHCTTATAPDTLLPVARSTNPSALATDTANGTAQHASRPNHHPRAPNKPPRSPLCAEAAITQ